MNKRTAKRTKGKTAEPALGRIAYKGFDLNFQCRGLQYEVGKTFTHDGDLEICRSGFHACDYPLDIFSYYPPAESKFAQVEMHGECLTHDGDTKLAAASITIKAEINIPDLITSAINWITSRCNPATSNHATGSRSASSATGYQSASSATGDWSASSATGYQSARSATRDRSASSAAGDQSASSATGDQSASRATGDRSASSATGDQSASSATGDRSASSATGYQSASSATGDQSASSATGKAAVALNTGCYGKARAGEGGAIVVCAHDDEGNLLHIRASKVGENGIKPDVFYTLNSNGEFTEVPNV